MQQHVPGRDAILARVCVRDADETGPARAGMGRELCSLDVYVDGVACSTLGIANGGHLVQALGLGAV